MQRHSQRPAAARTRRLLTLLLLLPLLAHAGCTSLSKLGRGRNGPSTETAALGQKLDFYVECLNSIDRGLQGAYHDYTARVDRAKGPQAGHEPSLFVRNEIEPCYEQLKQGMAAPPARPELDAAAQTYLSALQQLAPLFKQASEYYRQEDYKDDRLAKGRQLHAPLLAAFTAFDQASERLHTALDAEDLRLKERELAEIEQQQGRNLSYLHRAVLLRAKQLVKLGQADPVDPAQFQPALDAYAQAIEEAAAYYTAHRAELQERGGCWQTVERADRDFLKEGKEKLRQLRAQQKPQPGIFGGDRFIEQYNNLVMLANNCSRML